MLKFICRLQEMYFPAEQDNLKTKKPPVLQAPARTYLLVRYGTVLHSNKNVLNFLIPDPTIKKRSGGKLSYLFCSHEFHKIGNFLVQQVQKTE